MNCQTSKKGQQGQALILIALAAVGLFAFSALAIDGSRSFSNKRHAQNAADTSVLAAALAKARGNDYVVAAEDRAESNGFVDDADSSVEVALCSEVTCTGLPSGADPAEFIRVRIVSTIPATFGRVIGRQTLTSAAEAIARVQGDTASSTGNSSSGAAMVSTKDSTDNQCFLINGNANLETHDSGIFVNCSGGEALFINGSSNFTMGADSEVVGCKLDRGNTTGGTINCGADKMNVGPDTYANVPTMPNPPAPSDCSSIGLGSNVDNGDGTRTLRPGKFDALIIDKPTTMLPGVYCTNGAFNVQGQGSLTGTGTVQIVMPSSDFNVASNRVFTFDNLEIYTINNDFQVQGTLTANRLRFYSSGTGKSILNAQSSLTSHNAYFYLHRGTINWNGGTNVDLKAPPDGDPYVGGVLVHMPWWVDPNNPNIHTPDANLNGGSFALLYGTFLMPRSKVTFNGGTDFELHSQIIAYEYVVNGGGKIDIYYLANDLLSPPDVDNPTIELTK